MVVPPVPTNWALLVFQLPDVRAEKAVGLSDVKPPDVVIVSLTADVVSPVGVDVSNSVQFVPSPDVPIDRKSVVEAKPVDLGGPRTIKKRTAANTTVIATIRMLAI